MKTKINKVYNVVAELTEGWPSEDKERLLDELGMLLVSRESLYDTDMDGLT